MLLTKVSHGRRRWRRRRRPGSRHGLSRGGEEPGLSDELVAAAGDAVVHPAQTPLYHAENAYRYERQALIRTYQSAFSCRLVVVFDVLFPYS